MATALSVPKGWPTRQRVPAPVVNCDGSYRTPMWCPDTRRWELALVDGAGSRNVSTKSRAECKRSRVRSGSR